MEAYLDKYGRYHQKICINGEPSGNNGYIYSSYAQKVGLSLDVDSIQSCYNQCLVGGKFVLRSPGKELPPQSRDEITGACSLGLLKPDHLNKWSFSPYPLPRFSLIKLVKQLWELRPSLTWMTKGELLELGDSHYEEMKYRFFLRTRLEIKHRNYFWQNNLDQLYRFAFSVPLQDRYFILKKWGKFQWFNPAHVFYKAAAILDSKLGQPSGIRYLKYGGEKNKAAMVKEFPEDHPIRKKLGL